MSERHSALIAKIREHGGKFIQRSSSSAEYLVYGKKFGIPDEGTVGNRVWGNIAAQVEQHIQARVAARGDSARMDVDKMFGRQQPQPAPAPSPVLIEVPVPATVTTNCAQAPAAEATSWPNDGMCRYCTPWSGPWTRRAQHVAKGHPEKPSVSKKSRRGLERATPALGRQPGTRKRRERVGGVDTAPVVGPTSRSIKDLVTELPQHFEAMRTSWSDLMTRAARVDAVCAEVLRIASNQERELEMVREHYRKLSEDFDKVRMVTSSLTPAWRITA